LEKYNTAFVGARRFNFHPGDIKNTFFRANKISYEMMAQYVAGAKVCIDIPRDMFKDCCFGSVNTKRVPATCLSPRIFESCLAGSLCFTSADRSDIFDLFPVNMFPVYADQNHLIELLEEYINDDDKRNKLVEKQRS
jgi:spore maturation protein CgeB